MKDLKVQGKAKSRDYGRPPHRLLYFLARIIITMISKPFFHLDWSVDPRIKDLPRPLIVLGNHPSYFDPFFVACALYPMKINFLASSTFFRMKKFELLLYLAGVIPKTQFRADPGAIKSMLKVVKRNGVLGIFPEGARSIDGTSLPIEDSITKFIKKVGGGVIAGISHGSYLTWPRWSGSGFRRGKIHIDISLLFTREEVAELPLQDINNVVMKTFGYDEYKWQEANHISYRSKAPAKGLHNILHRCPACRKQWITDTTDTTLFCRSCGNTAVMDSYGYLHPFDDTSVVYETVRDWNRWQIDTLSGEVMSGDYFLEDEAVLYISEQEKPYALSGEGNIRLDQSGFIFSGTLLDEKAVKTFPISGVLGLSSDYGVNFDLVSDRFTYRFVLKNGQKSISFTHALDLLRKTV